MFQLDYYRSWKRKQSNVLITLLKEFPDIDWNPELGSNPNITWGDVKEHKNITWDYDYLSENPNITWDIVKSNKDKEWNYQHLSENPNITWDIVKTNMNEGWHFGLLSHNVNITWDIVKENNNVEWCFSYLSENPNITWDIVKTNNMPSMCWVYDNLSKNKNITWETVKENKNMNWNYYYLTRNPNITWDIIKANPNEPWDYVFIASGRQKDITWEVITGDNLLSKYIGRDGEYVSYWHRVNIGQNPNITWDIIKANQHKKWDIENISRNSSLCYSDIIDILSNADKFDKRRYNTELFDASIFSNNVFLFNDVTIFRRYEIYREVFRALDFSLIPDIINLVECYNY